MTIQSPSSSYALEEPTMGLRWYKGVLQQAWTVSSFVDNRRIDTKIIWRNIPHIFETPEPLDDAS